MLQARLGAALGSCALLAHAAFVWHERTARSPSSAAQLRFSAGGEDDLVADTLRTGDLLLFSRDCVLYCCAGAAVCEARKACSGCSFDQAAAIVCLRGVPHVLERTHSGAKLRRYDARIRCSRSREVLLRRLLHTSAEQRAAGEAFAAQLQQQQPQQPQQLLPGEAMRSSMLDPAAAAGALQEALTIVAQDGSANSSLPLLEAFYAAMGLSLKNSQPRSSSSSSSSSSQRLSMQRLAPPAQPWASRCCFGESVWVRDLR
jgi:hypothetical protein